MKRYLLSLLVFAGATATSAFGQTVTCSSNDGGYHFCSAPNGGAQMIRQRSGSACIQGRTWGSTADGVWVDRGCRADFSVNQNYNGRGYRNNGYYNGNNGYNNNGYYNGNNGYYGNGNGRARGHDKDHDRDWRKDRDRDKYRRDRDHDHDRDDR